MKLYTMIRGTPPVEAGWIRLGRFGYGFSWTRMAPLFSERYGYRRALFTFRGWRVFFLKRVGFPYTGSPSRPAVECCATCEQPKSRTNVAGEEVGRGWPVCINPDCVAFGEGVASATYRDIDTPDEEWVKLGEREPSDGGKA